MKAAGRIGTDQEQGRMTNMSPDSSSLAQTLLAAPAWCRVGLTAPSARTREAAAAELAQTILGALEDSTPAYDARQMRLPL